MPDYSEIFIENSIKAALASIEIYNKPDFKYREQSFTILNVNAWELLLKAKVVKDAGEDITSLYIQKPDGTYKKNRSGNSMTIEILGLFSKVTLDQLVSENIKALVEIRDTVTHFYYDDVLEYVIFSLAVASLKNYQSLIKQWFGKSLAEYNFHILPLAFSYDFRTLAMLDLTDKPDAIANIIRMVSKSHDEMDSSDDFHFICEVTTEIKSAKKFDGDADFTTVIDADANPGTATFVKTQNLHDKYPLNFKGLVAEVKKLKPDVKQGQISKFIKHHNLKRNAKYSHFLFTRKELEDKYKNSGELPKMILSIYSHEAVRFIVGNLDF